MSTAVDALATGLHDVASLCELAALLQPRDAVRFIPRLVEHLARLEREARQIRDTIIHSNEEKPR